MSVYSGFGTREQETMYNGYLHKMFLLLEKRILWTSKEENYDQDKWKMTFEKIYKNMALMEKSKYLPPKFSQCLAELAEYFGIKEMIEIQERSEIMSRNSSRTLPNKVKNRAEQLTNKIMNNNTSVQDEKMLEIEKYKPRALTKEPDRSNISDSKMKYNKKMPTPNDLNISAYLRNQRYIEIYPAKSNNLLNSKQIQVLNKTDSHQDNHLPELSKTVQKAKDFKQKWSESEIKNNNLASDKLIIGFSAKEDKKTGKNYLNNGFSNTNERLINQSPENYGQIIKIHSTGEFINGVTEDNLNKGMNTPNINKNDLRRLSQTRKFIDQDEINNFNEKSGMDLNNISGSLNHEIVENQRIMHYSLNKLQTFLAHLHKIYSMIL